jgi:site-specific DNA-methyltransferase (adenine-specific)
MSEKNQLYFGDNLDVLRRYVADESVDLEYLDRRSRATRITVSYSSRMGAGRRDTMVGTDR